MTMNKLGKKIFTVSVVALTIVWSVGVSAFLPTGVKAVDCPELEAGDLFKAKGNPAVFLLNDDLQKMDFFSAEVYYSWYSDSLAKEGGVEVDGECLDHYNYGGTVSFRPGSRLVKGPSAAVYTMLPDGSYKKIANEAAAIKLFGSKWYTLVRDVTEGSYFSHFTKASGELDGTELVDGMLVKTSATGKVYSITDGMAYEVDGTLPKALVNDVRTVTTALLDSVEMADETMTPAEITADPAMGLTNESTGTGTTVPTAAGSVTVSLAASTPAAANLADGTSFNPLLKFTLSAGKDGATVKGVTLKKGGFTA
ncbi:MAG TPA: hypothetical protein PLV72_03090, partial [Candidatus Magasanikbacteria bacterium]|nr:hypothetical protein [Candidatus Magasanikbacteria bacterium]